MFLARQLFIIFICCCFSPAYAQVPPTKKQINTWTKSLSIKRDPRAAKLKEVIHEIRETDPDTWCQTMDYLHQSALDENIRCQIRTKLLHHMLGGFGISCFIPDEKIREALQVAYEIEDELLQYELHLRLGQIYNQLKQYGLAAMHYHLLFEVVDHHQRADFYIPAIALYDMSYGLYYTHDYEGCIEKGLSALHALPNPRFIPDDTLNDALQMQGWNTVGLAYHKSQHHALAFQAFEHAEELARVNNNKTWVGIIKGNKGDVYYDLGRYDSAYALLQYDYDESVAVHEMDNAANSLQWIARIDLRNGDIDEALQKLYTARQLLYEKGQAKYLANVYYAFTQAYTELGKADSVNFYLQKYLHLHDSLQTEITKSRTDILKMRMNNVEQIQTIKTLNREKQQIGMTRNFTIVLVVLLGILAYVWLNRQRLKMQLRQREALEGKRLAEAEAQKAIEELEVFRQNLLEKNAQIERLQTTYEAKEISEDQNRRLSDLTHHLILNEDDWLRFKALFDSVYPGFFHSLRNKVPDITQAEQRMAALSKLKLTAREAANLLGVSPNTVYTTRRRLRQRLGLEQDSDLDPYLSSNEYQ